MRRKAPSLAPGPLSRLDAAIVAGRGDEFASLLPLLKEQCPEEAVERLRHPGGLRTGAMVDLLKALEPSAQKAKARRSARLATDGSRTRLRLTLLRTAPLLDLDTQDLQVLLSEALHLEGCRPALDLGRHPRPIVTLAPPLSPSVEGRDEQAEIELQSEPGADWMSRVNARLPEGIRIVAAAALAGWATALLDLAFRADYAWPCPLPPAEARAAFAAFMAAETFHLEKPGKAGGQKVEKKVDLRPEVIEALWDGPLLRFSMPLRPGKALSPLKLLAAIFGMAPSEIRGLVRERIHLAPDPREGRAERFETKLKNLYEDATLLTAGGNITLVDEDDEEPTVLG
jgi:hypothetical protein